MKISIVMPTEANRIPLLLNTINEYEKQDTSEIEFIIVSRTIKEKPHHLIDKIITYKWEGDSINPALALNLGVINSTHENVIITCPEVKPTTRVIEQLQSCGRANVVCQVFDTGEQGQITISLVNKAFRGEDPGMYFLAMFKKEDILAINGWDLEFMHSYAYEDNDFGARFKRAGLSHTIREDIQAIHQWHPRGTVCPELSKARAHFNNNNNNMVIRPKQGLREAIEYENNNNR